MYVLVLCMWVIVQSWYYACEYHYEWCMLYVHVHVWVYLNLERDTIVRVYAQSDNLERKMWQLIIYVMCVCNIIIIIARVDISKLLSISQTLFLLDT